jgi:hypothetical protein
VKFIPLFRKTMDRLKYMNYQIVSHRLLLACAGTVFASAAFAQTTAPGAVFIMNNSAKERSPKSAPLRRAAAEAAASPTRLNRKARWR